MSERYPSVPEKKLKEGGWERRARTEETVFRLPGIRVTGRTVMYEDGRLRRALEAADEGGRIGPADENMTTGTHFVTDADSEIWRFFFATALSFRPPLTGIGPAAVLPTVASEARRSFVSDFESRGFEAVTQGSRQRVRTETGDRAQLVKITAQFPLADGDQYSSHIDVEGWLAVWTHRGTILIAGGAYPVAGLETLFEHRPPAERPSADAREFRAELLELIRAVR